MITTKWLESVGCKLTLSSYKSGGRLFALDLKGQKVAEWSDEDYLWRPLSSLKFKRKKFRFRVKAISEGKQ